MADLKLKDGDYEINQILDSLKKDFNSERELCEYIEANIASFCKDCLGVTYKSHIREKPLSQLTSKRSIKGNKRIDFLIITSDNERIGIECKNPKYQSELSYAVGQCLTYLTLFELMGEPISRMAIVATKIEPSLTFTIDKFNLPILFIAMDKDKTLTYRNGSGKG